MGLLDNIKVSTISQQCRHPALKLESTEAYLHELPNSLKLTAIKIKYFACTNAAPCTATRPLKTLIKTPISRRV